MTTSARARVSHPCRGFYFDLRGKHEGLPKKTKKTHRPLVGSARNEYSIMRAICDGLRVPASITMPLYFESIVEVSGENTRSRQK